MLTVYLRAAMCKAKYEILPEDRTYYGEIPGFQGVYASAATLSISGDTIKDYGWQCT